MNIIERDLSYIWHPTAQMHDYESFLPIEVVEAKGSYFYTASGDKIIDAISSWWCKSLGHKHELLQQAIKRQIDKFEHIILAHTTHKVIVDFAEKICQQASYDKVFFCRIRFRCYRDCL